MTEPRLRFRDPYLHRLRRLYVRSLAQMRFLGREYIDWQTFQELWRPELMAQQGREPDQIVISKIRYDLPYSRQNCCLTRRSQALHCQKLYQSYKTPREIRPDYIIRKIDETTSSTTDHTQHTDSV